MKHFPVKIDMSDFFDGKQRMVMLLVDPEWENVERLQQRMKNLFNIVALELQTDDGFYIPPQEPIKLLRHTTLLKAFKPKETKAPATKQLQREVFEPLIQKRKFYSLGSDVIADATPKKKRKRSSAVANAANDLEVGGQEAPKQASVSAELSAYLDSLVEEDEQQKSQKRRRSSKVANAANELQVNGQEASKETSVTAELSAYLDSLVEEDEQQKSQKKTKKRSRRKKTTIEAKSTEKVDNEPAALPPISSPNKSLRASVQQAATVEANQSTHTYFNETANETANVSEQPAEEVPAAKVIFRCNLRQIDNRQPRVFKIPGTTLCTSNGSKKPTKEENGISKAFAMKSTKSYEEHVVSLEKDVNRIIADLQVPRHQSFASSTQTDDACNTSAADSIERSLAETNLSAVPANDDAMLTEQHADGSVTQPTSERTADNPSVVGNDDKPIETEVGKETTFLTSEESEIIDLNETDTVDFPTVEQMLFCSTDLVDMPAVGQTVLFKLASPDKPGIISKYIAGKLDHLNKRTKTLKFYIIDGHEELCNFSAKYACDLNNTTNTHIFYIKRSELIDPKVCLEIN